MPDEPRVRIEILSAWIARVEVTRSRGDFGLHPESSLPSSPGARTYQLGYRDAPLYRLRRPGSPQEDWEITPLRSGRCIEGLEAFDPEVDPRYLDWFVESGDLQGLEIPWLLPVGSYLLVQTSRPIYPVRWMLLGDKRVVAPPNVHQLRAQRTFYACVIGSARDDPPLVDQPLVGLTLLDYSPQNALHGLFFFSFSRTRRAPRERKTQPGGVLIVPLEGALVLGPGGADPEARDARCRRDWTEVLARRFVDWCAWLTEEWRE
jgi:hypothetical protein